MFSLIKLPYVLSLWALAATCGPALGPIISGFSVTAKNWRWSLWELLWLAGPIWILLFLCLPETSPSNILLRRANRLRKRTPDVKLKSQSEIDQANLKVWDLIKENLWRPNQMMVLDPAVGFTAIYTALGEYFQTRKQTTTRIANLKIVYAIFYSFFEVSSQLRPLAPPPLIRLVLPARLRRNVPFQPRRTGPNLPLHHRRRDHSNRGILGLHLLHHGTRDPSARSRCSRKTSYTRPRILHFLPCRIIHLRMVQ